MSTTSKNIGQQGSIRITEDKGDIAIDGDGFFLVKSGTTGENATGLIRTGDFRPDKNGFLTNDAGYCLQGQRLVVGEAVTPSIAALEPVQIPKEVGTATTGIALKTLLPEAPTDGDEVKETLQFYDAKGNKHDMTVTYEYDEAADGDAGPGWLVKVEVDGIAQNDDLTQERNTTPGTTVDAKESYLVPRGSAAPEWKFIGSATGGTAGAASPSIQQLALRFAEGGNTETIALDLSGIRTSTSTTAEISNQTTSTQEGGLKEVFDWGITQDGKIDLSLSDGSVYQLYQLPLATCINPDGLTEKSNGVYFANGDSGALTINFAEKGGMGAILSGAQEASTVDIAKELSEMITTQHAYYANTKVISTVSEMLDLLMRL
jgi:flagellar hook protein FlgE